LQTKQGESSGHRQIAQRFGNVAFSEIARIPFAVEQKQAPNPVHLRFLGVQPIVPQTYQLPDLFEQFPLALLNRLDNEEPMLSFYREPFSVKTRIDETRFRRS
jgi:hypothetical protein